MKKEAGGTVRVSSMETAENYIITVKDDGVGIRVTLWMRWPCDPAVM